MHRHCHTVHTDINPRGYQWHPITSATVRLENSVNTDCSHPCWIPRVVLHRIRDNYANVWEYIQRKVWYMASALEKEDAVALKGAKSKEDLDRGAACSDPHHNESMLRETSPQRSPSNLHTRECFALLFGVEVAPTVEDGVGSHILPTYAWTERVIFDILSPTIEDISQVVILNPMECLVFRGHHSRGKGFTYGEALAFSDIYHRETTTWIGHRVKMHCIMHTLGDARGDLRMVRDQEHDKNP